MNAFIVQEAIHADHVSRHETAEEAAAVIDGLVRDGTVEAGDLNIRELDSAGRTVRVFAPGAEPSQTTAALTPREREILRHLADGRSNDEIARRLAISSVTVRAHIRRVMTKLGVATEREAVESMRRDSRVA